MSYLQYVAYFSHEQSPAQMLHLSRGLFIFWKVPPLTELASHEQQVLPILSLIVEPDCSDLHHIRTHFQYRQDDFTFISD